MNEDKLVNLLDLKIKENLTVFKHSFDGETSGLHREILKKISGLDDKVDEINKVVISHDESIKSFTEILPEITKAIEAYRATNTIGKAVIGIIIGVPAISAFIAGVLYILDFFNKKSL